VLLTAEIDAETYHAVLLFAARHELAVADVVAAALVEFLLDVEAGLLAVPQRRPAWERRPTPAYMREGRRAA
jgi:hypothetical protein